MTELIPRPTEWRARHGYALYIDLLKRALINTIYGDPDFTPGSDLAYHEDRRLMGRDWPRDAHSMVGKARLDNLQYCVEQVIRNDVPGDFIETGVWRGGSCILIKAILTASGITDRRVWLADSFCGFPAPDPETYPLDEGLHFTGHREMIVPLETVKDNFRRYGLLDESVCFLPGWFRDTLPTAPIERLAVLRLDGDLYESTMIALESLYHKLSEGGFVIVDDFNCIDQCKRAVLDFRARNNITEPILEIDWDGVYWQKEADDRPVPTPEAPTPFQGPPGAADLTRATLAAAGAIMVPPVVPQSTQQS
jgi:Macrocin-O-methyltransferase (TylF)